MTVTIIVERVLAHFHLFFMPSFFLVMEWLNILWQAVRGASGVMNGDLSAKHLQQRDVPVVY